MVNFVCFSGAFITSSELQSVRLYPYTNSLHIFVVAAEVIYFLLIVYYMVVQVRVKGKLSWQHHLVSSFCFIYKNFRTGLDFSSATADLHQRKTESDTVSVLNNKKADVLLVSSASFERDNEKLVQDIVLLMCTCLLHCREDSPSL